MRTRLAIILLGATAAAGLPDEKSLRDGGVDALGGILKLTASKDLDTRLCARRLAKRVIHEHYRSSVPEGMRFVAGPVSLRPDGAEMDGVYLAAREVTVREFLDYARATRLRTTRWNGAAGGMPVTEVTLDEARGYAAWRRARLPTKDELLREASRGRRAAYPWGERFEARRVNSRESGLGVALPPGARPLGRSAAGLDDLLGNVAEWTVTTVAKAARTKRFCVVGGSFLRHARGVISGGRFVTYKLRATEHRRDVGFRIARSLPPLQLDKRR